MSLSGWSCFVELCAMSHVAILKPTIVGQTRWGGHHEHVVWHTIRELPVCEYNSEGPNTAIWLMDFEYPHLTGAAKCKLHTWEWENSKVSSAVLTIPHDSTLLMQGTILVSYIQSCHSSSLSDDLSSWNTQHHVCSHRTEGDYFQRWNTWKSWHARYDETHSEGEDTDGTEHL